MTAKGRDSITQPSPPEKSNSYTNSFCRELALFRPSPVLEQVNGLLSAVPVDLRKLGRASHNDPSLATEAIKLVNSSLFGLARPVSSLEQAVVATDADVVRTLLLTCWLTRLSGNNVATRENQLFWSHSLMVAQLSRRVSEATDLAQPEQAFLAGLLHDVGVLPFLTLLSREGTAASLDTFANCRESIEMERLRFGIDHCELGRRLAAIPDFPLPLAEVISKHHQPSLAVSSFPLLLIVGITEAISQVHYLCAHQGKPIEAMGAYMKDSVKMWLPGLSTAANRTLLATLEADLFESTSRFKPSGEKVWTNSFSRAHDQPHTEKSSSKCG